MNPNDIIKPDVNDHEFESEEPLLQSDERDLQQEAPGQDVTDEMIRQDVSNPNSWLVYNKGPEETGYSPASRITRENVDSLSLEYTVDDYSGFENEPIVVPSGEGEPPVLYYTRPSPQTVTAINARTGEEYWTFTYANDDTKGLTASNRGVAVRGDKVYLGSHDNHIVALDRYTGEKQWETLTLTQKQQEEMSVPERMANTQAPIAFDGTIFKGMTGYYGGWGAYHAVDAESGEVKWQQTVIPEDRWVGDSWRYGDGSPWNNAAIDPESGTIFVPVANPGPMLNGVVRPGPNKHSNSVLALDTQSGEVKWATQLVPHDWHDYDTYNTRIVEMEVAGETQRVVEVINKTGWLYFLDIETGQLIERTMPYAKQGGEVPFLGLLPKGEENKASVWPSDWGATEWTPDSYSPRTGLVYVAANDTGKDYWYSDYEYNEEAAETNVGGGWSQLDFEEHEDIRSHIVAMNPATGQEVWRHSFERDPEQSRAGGTTATAGNVVFGGSPTGDLVAVDAESGDELWSQQISGLPRGITAAPVTWDDPEAGKQFVAIASLSGIKVFGLEAQAEGEETGTATTTENGTATDADAAGDGTTDTTTPGFGAAAGAAGVGGAAYLAKKRRENRDDTEETDETDDTTSNE